MTKNSNQEERIAEEKSRLERVKMVEQHETMQALRWKMGQYRIPLAQMKIVYPKSALKRKVYSEDEDRFLLCMRHKHGGVGHDIYGMLRHEIRDCPLFRFDYLMLSRTPIEIGRRCKTLLTAVRREWESAGKPDDAVDQNAPRQEGEQLETTSGGNGSAPNASTELLL